MQEKKGRCTRKERQIYKKRKADIQEKKGRYTRKEKADKKRKTDIQEKEGELGSSVLRQGRITMESLIVPFPTTATASDLQSNWTDAESGEEVPLIATRQILFRGWELGEGVRHLLRLDAGPP
ncbi:hypothetical protein CEXT_378821 [Caerostris extrusa]|uniref:Uncharacterized protein n=1 Tax=Caerostris extrusa TaxID=172846 RepID=A0AAV4SNI9_CAEEX|nr:hypothetical protein CEXT_378821 [Caerostris extrusa]